MNDATASWSTAELLSETRWMRALARRLADGTGEDPDDLVQDALVAALERRPRGDRPLRPWLGSVVRNRFAFSRRSAGGRRARERAVAAAEAVAPADELLERAELHGRVVHALTALREPQRGVLLARFFAGLTPSEIARQRGVPAATVRSQIHRGLREIRSELDRGFDGDRRRARLALVALAEAPVSTVRDPAPSLLETLKAMNPTTQLIVVASTIVVAGSLYRLRLHSPAGVGGSPPTVPGAPTSAEPASAARPSPGRIALAPLIPSSPTDQDEAAVTGVVRDAGGTPLRGFALELRHAESASDPVWSEPELLWTDDAGHYTSLLTYPAGRLSISLIDHPDQRLVARFARQFQGASVGSRLGRGWAPDQGSVDLKVPAGPSYTLDLSGLGELEPAALTGSLEPVEDEPWGALPTSRIALAPVRAGAPPWIRFPDLRGAEDATRPWRLSVEGLGGLLAGEARVQVGEGAPAEPVAIALVPAARLDVSLVIGPSVVGPAVTLEAVPGGERRPMLPLTVQDLPAGRRAVQFARTALPGGTYRVLVSIDDLDQLADTVTLVAGEAASRTIELGESAAGTRVEGELRSQTGTYHESTTVCLFGAAGEVLHVAPVRWVEQDGKWVAPFAVDNLPPEVCELKLLSMGSFRRWSGLPAYVAPPQADLVFVCDDVEPVHELWIRVVDAGTGERIGSGWGTIELEGCEESQTSIGLAGMSVFEKVPTGALTGWYAAADGFAPRWGGAEAFLPEGERLAVEVALEPGWGARIRASRAGTLPAEPLAGVRVLLDGEPAGVTNEDGELVLARETAPERVEVVLEGWTYAGGDLDTTTGRLAEFRSWHLLRFAQ